MPLTKVLFLCTGNSCRSQMAEGWAHHLLKDRVEPYSAGIEAHGMNPNAVKVMQEAGVDITGQSSKLVSTLQDVPLDLVITVCGHADENCPAFHGNARVVHVGFDDPQNSRRMPRPRKKLCSTIGECATKFVNSSSIDCRSFSKIRSQPVVSEGHGTRQSSI